MRRKIRWLGLLVALGGCGSPGDPGLFTKPTKTTTHGRFVEKRYTYHDGPQTRPYSVLEIDGRAFDVDGGYVNHVSFCKEPGLDAAALLVRGDKGVPGIYVLQLDGDRQLFERICDFGPLISWNGARYSCETTWDARAKARVSKD